MSKLLVLKPKMSEKAYDVSQSSVYVFAVPKNANKHTVAQAVSSQFDVTVTSVNITNISGKVKQSVRKRGRRASGRDSDIRKAYVTLKSGDSLPVFAAVEKAEQEAEKIEKASKKAAKKEKT
jgi:large subunit ribosomal protein L23